MTEAVNTLAADENGIRTDENGVKILPNGVQVFPNGDQIIPVEVMEQQAYETARENQLQNNMKEAARLAAKVHVLQMQVQNLQQENAALKQFITQAQNGGQPAPGTIPRTVIKSLPGTQKQVLDQVTDDVASEAKRKIAETAGAATANLNKKPH